MIEWMRVVLLIVRRELRSFFVQPLAWVIWTGLLTINGIFFWTVLAAFNQSLGQADVPSTEIVRWFFSGLLVWLSLLTSLPLIAMRVIAEERQTGTLESLLTAPVNEGQVALGKFLAAFGLFAVLWSPMLIYIGVLDLYGDVDWGPALAGFGGMLLVGGYLLSAALCASALARNQIVAAAIGFVGVLALFLVPMMAELFFSSGVWSEFWSHLNLLAAMDEFPRGIVRSSRLVYPLSGIVFFVFTTARLIELSKANS